MDRIVKRRPLPGTTSSREQAYEVSHRIIAREAAREGIVLLKNDDDFLPLEHGCPVALFGAGVSKTVKGGTGSGDVNERHSVTIYEGMKKAGFQIANESWVERYEKVYRDARQRWKEEVLRNNSSGSGMGLDFFLAYAATPFYLPAGPDAESSDADTAIYVISRVAGEGADRYARSGDYYLSEEEHRLLSQICSLYRDVVVILNTGIMDVSFLEEFPNIRAMLYISQPGMEGGNAVADILSGSFSPCGKLTDTWTFRYEDYPNAETFSHNNGDVTKEIYSEGLYVGYRYFDSFDIPVRYGMGYGLSYTAFDISSENLAVNEQGEISLTVLVTNIGKVSGKEVVQLYTALPDGDVEKECRRLCAFAKTKELAPGESQSLVLTCGSMELASYDQEHTAWLMEKGLYGLYVGDSLAGSRLIGALEVSENTILCKTGHICQTQESISELSRPESARAAWYEKQRMEYLSVPVIPYEPNTSLADSAARDIALDHEEETDQILRSLSVEQMIQLTTGDPGKGQGSVLGSSGISLPGSAGETSSCAREQGLANIVLADGPAGLRLNQNYYVKDGSPQMLPFEASIEKGFFYDGEEPEGEKYYQYCTAIPVGTLLAQTWNTELLHDVGYMIGEEMEHFGVTLWLAPGMNLHRNPLCGRNFEYYSEDPLLSGEMAAAITNGVQMHPGCGTTIKHFACNNQEDNRMHSDSILSERVLRELYLRPFGIAIRKSRPFAIMTSYNLINGIHTANSYDLCTVAAKHEFGFRGIIVTDWNTTEQGDDCTAAGCIHAGNDLIMPGSLADHACIREALETGELSRGELECCVRRIIRLALSADAYE